MPASAGTPTTQMPPQMAHTPQPPPPAEPTAEAPAAAAANRPGIRAQIAENPLTSLLGGIIIILLAATFATSNIRIDDTNDRITRLEGKIDTRFAAQDQKIDTRFAQVDARFAAQDQKIDTKFAQVDARFAAQDQKIDARFDSLESDVAEINLKLTALIAALNATDTVNAALEGRLTGADTADPAGEAR